MKDKNTIFFEKRFLKSNGEPQNENSIEDKFKLFTKRFIEEIQGNLVYTAAMADAERKVLTKDAKYIIYFLTKIQSQNYAPYLGDANAFFYRLAEFNDPRLSFWFLTNPYTTGSEPEIKKLHLDIISNSSSIKMKAQTIVYCDRLNKKEKEAIKDAIVASGDIEENFWVAKELIKNRKSGEYKPYANVVLKANFSNVEPYQREFVIPFQNELNEKINERNTTLEQLTREI